MGTYPLILGVSGPDIRALLDVVYALKELSDKPPVELMVNGDEVRVTDDWYETWVPRTEFELMAGWTPEEEERAFMRMLDYSPNTIVSAWLPGFFSRPEEVLELVSSWPVELVSLTSPHVDAWQECGYPTYGFSDLHHPYTWGCVFKGRGHERLVSRRWLDHGPWRVLRGPNDTTLVQFHDLAADAAVAFEQAYPAQERMGISDTGGFLQTNYVYSQDIAGLYPADERTLEFVIHTGGVSELAMLDVCALRAAGDPARPVERIAYVFIDEQVARAHLHQLWLRELECWTFVDGEKVRLDADYHPQPTPPAWVQALAPSRS